MECSIPHWINFGFLGHIPIPSRREGFFTTGGESNRDEVRDTKPIPYGIEKRIPLLEIHPERVAFSDFF
jgi:hypothetical protein